MADLFHMESIELVSGVNDDFEGFLHVNVLTADGSMVKGQIDVDAARKIGLDFLATAEAADSDSAMARMHKVLGIPWEASGQMIALLRKFRTQPPQGDQPT